MAAGKGIRSDKKQQNSRITKADDIFEGRLSESGSRCSRSLALVHIITNISLLKT
jgi:hypothetical protein